MLKRRYYPVLLLFVGLNCFSQTVIFLTNPSFEDNPGYARVPGGWQNCAFNEESPPDVHPVPNGVLGVTQRPYNGDTYLGLVVRQTASTESVGQKMPQPLQPGQCYNFSLYLSHSSILVSRRRTRSDTAHFDAPAVLRVWGGMSPGGRKSLLAESPAIAHTDWKKYSFRFRAPEALTYLTLEAWWKNNADTAYNGNLLLDHVQPLVPVDCQTFEPLVKLDSLDFPAFNFRKFKPLPDELETETRVFKGVREWIVMNFEIVNDSTELESFMDRKCNRIGFRPGQKRLDDFTMLQLQEVAYNVRQYSQYRLLIGLSDAGKKLNATRIRSIKKALRKVELPDRRFKVSVNPAASREQGWLCGHGEIWLRIERN